MTKPTPPDPIAVRLRRFRQRWGSALLIAVVAHVCIGAAVVALYYASKPPPPGYVIVDLLTPRPSPTADATPAPH